jgi:hypothetical protein
VRRGHFGRLSRGVDAARWRTALLRVARRRRRRYVERMHPIGRYLVRVGAGSALVLLPLSVAAHSLDGTYDGTIHCGLVTDAKRVWESPFRLIVEDGAAQYERPILRDGQPTGVYERGDGTVTGSGKVGLAGRAQGSSYVFDAQYQGELTQDAARLVGTQLWYIRGHDDESERSCHITLIRVPPVS